VQERQVLLGDPVEATERPAVAALLAVVVQRGLQQRSSAAVAAPSRESVRPSRR
jgi:hypothetical protein